MRFLLNILLLVFGTVSAAYGQKEFSYTQVPLQQSVRIRILGSDKQVLHCYNLYGYAYTTPDDSITGEFIVAKNEDTFQNKEYVTVKFCTPKEFMIGAGNACRAIPVETGIELTYPGQSEKVYLNFDTTGPDAVFIPCK